MKLRLLALVLVLLATMSTTFQKKTRIVFFGDSITQAGIKPGGYVTLIGDSLAKRGMASQYELIGAGVSGNKVYDLYLRMEDDVLAKNPDIVFIWIGVNDVWHKASSGTGTDANKFTGFYEAIIKKLQAKNIQVVLATPAAIGERTDYTNQQDGDLNLYSRIIRDLAKKYNCKLVDLRNAFHEYGLKNNPENKESGILTTDRVHLNEKGNQFVADNFWSVVIGR